nr:MAG TPA_asm: hypothetical protein [Caudoviricetes sp.]
MLLLLLPCLKCTIFSENFEVLIVNFFLLTFNFSL